MQQLSLFPRPSETAEDALSAVPGLLYLREFIAKSTEVSLLQHIDSASWLTALKRRVQHYGYRYDYKARRIDHSMQLGPMPPWIDALGNMLQERGVLDQPPDQAIINEYTPGQGIARHIDCEPCFGETVASLSLLSGVVMDFEQADTGELRSMWLEPRSLVVLRQDARYRWKHGIAARLTDGPGMTRGRRISMTFRTVILDARP